MQIGTTLSKPAGARRIVRCALFALAATCLVPGWMMANAAEPQKIASVEGITEYQLDNGLKVLLFPDPSKPTVTVNLTVFVGSRHEGYGETGMAHLLEHMVFKSTPSRENIAKLLQDKGAQFNGTTSIDRTNYFETLPASDENLEFALALEADRMVNATLKNEDLQSEFSVVRSEFERGENSPAAILMQRITAVAYEWHNYGKRTIGNRTDIERVPIDNLRAFYEKFYQPDNVMVIVAGAIDEAKTLAMIQKHFGAIPRPTRKLGKTYTEEPAQDGERSVTLRRVGDTGQIGIAYHIPAASHPEFASLEILTGILTAEPSGRLYKELVENKIAASTGGFCQKAYDPGLLMLFAEVKKGDSLAKAQEALILNTERIAETGVSEEEVNRARQRLLKQWDQSASNVSGLAVGLSNWASQGDWRLFFIYRDRLEQVTAASVRAAAEKYLQRANRTVGVYEPTDKPERTSVPSRPDITELVSSYKGRSAISAGEAFDVSPLNVEKRSERFKIGGMNVVLLPKKSRDSAVRMAMTFRYGNEENLRGRATAAENLAPMMVRGTKNLSRQKISDEFDRLKSQVGASSGLGAASFSVQTRRGTFVEVCQILQQILREPSFPAEEFEVIKRQDLADIDAQRTEPQNLAPIALQRLIMPYAADDVRYTPTIAERIERAQSASLDQVVELYRDYLSAEHGEIAIVGDFDPAEARKQLEMMLAGWKTTKPYARIAEPIRSEPRALTETIRTPDKANAVYAAGHLFPMSASDADYPAMVIANLVLGGSTLSSRLGDRIRRREGLSYGVRSSVSVSQQDERSELNITAICNPANMDRVVQAAMEELTRFVSDGITEEELAAMKTSFLQAQTVRRTEDAALAGLLNSTSYNGITMKFYEDLETNVKKLTVADVNAAVKKRLNPKLLTVVTAGDFTAEGAAAGGAPTGAAAGSK